MANIKFPIAANFDMDGERIINLADPIDDSDVATKRYVDDNSAATPASVLNHLNNATGKIDSDLLPANAFTSTETAEETIDKLNTYSGSKVLDSDLLPNNAFTSTETAQQTIDKLNAYAGTDVLDSDLLPNNAFTSTETAQQSLDKLNAYTGSTVLDSDLLPTNAFTSTETAQQTIDKLNAYAGTDVLDSDLLPSSVHTLHPDALSEVPDESVNINKLDSDLLVRGTNSWIDNDVTLPTTQAVADFVEPEEYNRRAAYPIGKVIYNSSNDKLYRVLVNIPANNDSDLDVLEAKNWVETFLDASDNTIDDMAVTFAKLDSDLLIRGTNTWIGSDTIIPTTQAVADYHDPESWDDDNYYPVGKLIFDNDALYRAVVNIPAGSSTDLATRVRDNHVEKIIDASGEEDVTFDRLDNDLVITSTETWLDSDIRIPTNKAISERFAALNPTTTEVEDIKDIKDLILGSALQHHNQFHALPFNPSQDYFGLMREGHTQVGLSYAETISAELYKFTRGQNSFYSKPGSGNLEIGDDTPEYNLARILEYKYQEDGISFDYYHVQWQTINATRNRASYNGTGDISSNTAYLSLQRLSEGHYKLINGHIPEDLEFRSSIDIRPIRYNDSDLNPYWNGLDLPANTGSFRFYRDSDTLVQLSTALAADSDSSLERAYYYERGNAIEPIDANIDTINPIERDVWGTFIEIVTTETTTVSPDPEHLITLEDETLRLENAQETIDKLNDYAGTSVLDSDLIPFIAPSTASEAREILTELNDLPASDTLDSDLIPLTKTHIIDNLNATTGKSILDSDLIPANAFESSGDAFVQFISYTNDSEQIVSAASRTGRPVPNVLWNTTPIENRGQNIIGPNRNSSNVHTVNGQTVCRAFSNLTNDDYLVRVEYILSYYADDGRKAEDSDYYVTSFLYLDSDYEATGVSLTDPYPTDGRAHSGDIVGVYIEPIGPAFKRGTLNGKAPSMIRVEETFVLRGGSETTTDGTGNPNSTFTIFFMSDQNGRLHTRNTFPAHGAGARLSQFNKTLQTSRLNITVLGKV